MKHRRNKTTASEMDPDDALWGNEEMTVEEFDFAQTQAEIITQGGQLHVESDPQRLRQEVEYLKEQQYTQDGQIKILRDALAARSKELDKERLERDRILDDRLRMQRDKEIQLQRNIERLQSELKFQEQEARTSANKVLALEKKLKQSPLANGSVSAKPKSDKTVKDGRFSFTEKPPCLSKDTQTDDGKAVSFHRSAALLEVSNIPDVSYIFPPITSRAHSPNLACRTSGESILPRPIRFSDKAIRKETLGNICSTNRGLHMNVADSLHINCYCTVESENKHGYPEVGMFQQMQRYVEEYTTAVSKMYGVQDIKLLSLESGHCSQCKKRISSPLTSSLGSTPRDTFHHAQILIVTAINELNDLISVSKTAGKVLLENCKSGTIKNTNSGSNDESSLLLLLVDAAVPLFSGKELINKSIIEWVLTVLHTLTTYGCVCCLKSLNTIVCNLCLNCMLDGNCGKEIAYLALKILCHCVPCAFAESFLGHHSEPCLLKSIAKFYSQFVTANKPIKDELRHFVPLVLDFLTRLITCHGNSVATSYGDHCNCFSELLEAVILCLSLVSRTNASKLVLRKGLHLLHLVSKTFPKFRELRSQVEDEYVMLICDLSTRCQVETELMDMMEIINYLWDFRQDKDNEFYQDDVRPMEIND